MLSEVFSEDRNINLEMIKAGLAEVYRGKPASGLDIETYWKAEGEAKTAKRVKRELALVRMERDILKKAAVSSTCQRNTIIKFLCWRTITITESQFFDCLTQGEINMEDPISFDLGDINQSLGISENVMVFVR